MSGGLRQGAQDDGERNRKVLECERAGERNGDCILCVTCLGIDYCTCIYVT